MQEENLYFVKRRHYTNGDKNCLLLDYSVHSNHVAIENGNNSSVPETRLNLRIARN